MTRKEFEKLNNLKDTLDFKEFLYSCLYIILYMVVVFGGICAWGFHMDNPENHSNVVYRILKWYFESTPDDGSVLMSMVFLIKGVLFVIVGLVAGGISFYYGLNIIEKHFFQLKKLNNCTSDVLDSYLYFIGDEYALKAKKFHPQDEDQKSLVLKIVDVDHEGEEVKMDNGEILSFDDLEKNYKLIQ